MRRIAGDLASYARGAGAGDSSTLRAADNWQLALHLADVHTVTPLLYGAYRASGALTQLPAPVRERLHTTYANTLSRAEWLAPAFAELVDGLHGAGIRFFMLKGFPLIDQIYGDRGLRTAFDIDFLLADQRDTQRAIDVMDGLRYEIIPGDHTPPGYRHLSPRWRPAPRPDGDYFNARLPWTIEAHTQLWESEWWGLTLGQLDGLWERRQERNVDGRSVATLSDSDNLIYLSMHQMLHVLSNHARLLHFYDIHRLANRLDAADWQPVWQRAEGQRLHTFLLAALHISRSVFGTTLPPAIGAEMDRCLGRGALGRWLRGSAADDILLQDWTQERGHRFRLAYWSRMFASGRRAKAWAFLQPVFKTIFPPAGYMRRKYRLSGSGVLAPYYARHIVTASVNVVARGARTLVERLSVGRRG